MIGKLLHKILNTLHVLIPVITAKEKNGSFDESFAKAYPNALAILLLHQLKKYPDTLKQRAEAIKAYDLHFSPGKTSQPTLSRYPVLVENRDEILQKAASKNIYLGKWYDQVVAPKEIDLAKMKYTLGTCPSAEEVSAKIINMPTTLSQASCTVITKILEKD
jgi:dTDP-4-amino-4,6-dideoxygalactose transaminase